MSTNKVIGFSKPEEENGYLSNRFPSWFDYAGETYSSGEQFLMAQKAILFGDYEILNEILLERDPEVIFELGREVQNYDETVWAKLRGPMMRRGLRAKFQQNPEWCEKLLETGESILAECTACDTVWGIGCNVDADEVQQPEKWCGKNLLGEVLMQVREDLRRWKEAANGDIHYEDATDAEACGVWKKPIPEILKMPKYREALDIYFEITLYRLHGDRFFIDNCTASPEELEFIIAGESGGGLPGAWFFEMKQDMYDLMRFESGGTE